MAVSLSLVERGGGARVQVGTAQLLEMVNRGGGEGGTVFSGRDASTGGNGVSFVAAAARPRAATTAATDLFRWSGGGAGWDTSVSYFCGITPPPTEAAAITVGRWRIGNGGNVAWWRGVVVVAG